MSRVLPAPPIGWIETRKTKRRGPRYLARYREEGKILTIGSFESHDAALNALAQAKQKLDRGISPSDGKMTLGEYITEVWLPSKRPPATAIRTYQSYESTLRVHVLPRLGHVPLDRLRHSMVQSAINDVAAAGTVANARAVLRPLKMVTKAAVIDLRIDQDPAQAVKVRKGEPDQQKWAVIQPDRIGAFFEALDAMEDERWRLMLLLEMEIGARLAELRALTPAVINFQSCEVTIAGTIGESSRKVLDEIDAWHRWPKGEHRIGATFFYKPTKANRIRVVPIDPSIAVMLEDYVARHELAHDALLFPSPEGGPLGGSYFHRAIWKPFLRDAGLPPMRVHDLRHTVASYNLDSGEMTWQEVMSLMGWSTVAIAQRYTHMLARPDRRSVSIRNKAYGRPERTLRVV